MERVEEDIESRRISWYDNGILTITIGELAKVFQASWCKGTSMAPEFRSTESPDFGQCMATTFVMKSLCGGEMAVEKCTIQDNATKESKMIPHFFSFVDKVRVDFTRDQLIDRESLKDTRLVEIQESYVLRHQDKEGYYRYFCESKLQEKESLLFERVKKQLCDMFSINIEEYLLAWKKIRLVA